MRVRKVKEEDKGMEMGKTEYGEEKIRLRDSSCC